MTYLFGVMAGRVPAIRVFLAAGTRERVDARDNPQIKPGDGHDGTEAIPFHRTCLNVCGDDPSAALLTLRTAVGGTAANLEDLQN